MTAWDLWDHRNKVLHGTGGPREVSETIALANDITIEYQQGPGGLRLMDQALFHDSLESILGSTTRKWLRSIRLARQELGPAAPLRADRIQLQRQQGLMHRWLRTAYQGPPPA